MKSRCPICNKVIDETTLQNSRDGKFYPFCSDRCKLIDLGKWLDGNYRIPAVEDDKADEDSAKTDTPDKTEND
jgi:uncharacterized protein